MDLPQPLITISPDYLSGAPVFTGTRVPVQALFDYIGLALLATVIVSQSMRKAIVQPVPR